MSVTGRPWHSIAVEEAHEMCTALISLVKCFSEGGFVVSVTGRPWHSIAVDEAHEMCINKSCKMFL